MTTDTKLTAEEVLELSAPKIGDTVAEMSDLPLLGELRARESAGQNRSTALAAIDKRLGQVFAQQAGIDKREQLTPEEATEIGQATTADDLTPQDALEQAGADDPALELMAESGITESVTEPLLQAIGSDEADEENAIEGGTQTHRTAKRVLMYHPTDQYGYMPTLVPASNLVMLLRAGYKAKCPDCGDKCRVRGIMPNNTLILEPNGCSGRIDIPFVRCPVCRRTFYDMVQWRIAPVERIGDEPDEMELELDDAANMTPENRLRIQRNSHILAVHPGDAPMFGLQLTSPKTRGRVERTLDVEQ